MLSARANIGESVEQVVHRYGAPTAYAEANAHSPFGRIMYKAGVYELVVFLLNGREVGARVSKVDKTELTDAEVKIILDRDTTPSGWTPLPSKDPNEAQWSRSDQVTVIHDKARHILIFTSADMLRALSATPVPVVAPGGLAPIPPPPALPAVARAPTATNQVSGTP